MNNAIWEDDYLNEIHIVRAGTFEHLAKCYRTFDKNHYGWCGTNQMNTIKKQKFQVSSTEGWGFCKKDCFPDPYKQQIGVPRYKDDVYILEPEYCEKLMKKRLKAKNLRKLKVDPKILCVGKNKTYKFQTYIKSGKKYHLVKLSEYKDHEMLENLHKDRKWYIVGKYLKSIILNNTS